MRILQNRKWLANLGLLWLLMMAACHPSKQTNQPKVVDASSTPTVTPEVKGQMPSHSEAVAKGLAFLGRCSWEMQFIYLYTYLQPKFHWADLPAQSHTSQVRDSLQRAGDANAKNILHEMTLFDRLLDPQYRITQTQMRSAEELDSVTIHALYCDVFAIDTAAYFPILRSESNASGYRCTHALLCYVWMKENGCFSAGILSKLLAYMLPLNQAIILQTPNYWSDLNIETAALLQAAGTKIPEDWIQGVIAAQRPDGGWGKYPNMGTSDSHATILALWLLAVN